MATFRGTANADFLFGGRGADLLQGFAGNDTLNGGAGNETLDGGEGADRLVGGDGDDLIRAGRNADFDQIIAGRGSDRIDFASAALTPGGAFAFWEMDYRTLRGGVEAVIGASTGTITKSALDGGGVDRMVNMSFDFRSEGLGFFGTHRADRFTINVARDVFVDIRPGGGADVITVNSGDSRLSYLDFDGAGIDVRVASSTGGRMAGVVDDQHGALDRFSGIVQIRGTRQDDTFRGSAGNDSFIPDQGDDVYDGRGGFDLVRYDRPGSVGVTINLATGVAVNRWDQGDGRRDGTYQDTLRNIEHVRGSNSDDVISGRTAAERLDGRAGDDRLSGGGGNDTLRGDAGNDRLDGGTGADTASYEGAAAVQVSLAIKVAQNTRGAGTDTLIAIENLQGGDGADRLTGSTGANALSGGAGADTLSGGAGADRLTGGVGNDRQTGGAGVDRFIFNRADGRDTITDFSDGVDRIVVDSGATSFAQVRVADSGADTVITFASTRITLLNEDHRLITAADFEFI